MTGRERPCRRREALRTLGSTVGLGGLIGLAGCGAADPPVSTVTFTHEKSSRTQPAHAVTGTTADGQAYRLLEDGVGWYARPVEFVLATGTVPADLSTPGVRRATAAALDAWNGVANADTVFHPPRFDAGLTGATQGNGVNEIAWTDDLGDVLAKATVRWNTRRGRLLEVDVEFDAATPWTTTPDRNPDAYDVQNLLTHELGHNGLRDVTEFPAQTMYHESSPGETRKRSPAAGDEAGWRRLYG